VTDVLIVGAGPVGLLLAGELARRGVDVAVLERREAAGAGSRAIGVHAPVLAALEASGVTEALLADAVRVRRGEARSRGRTIGVVQFDRLSTRFPFVATLPQAATERILAGRAPAPRRGARVTAVLPGTTEARVRVRVDGAEREMTAPLVVVAGGAGGREIVYRRGSVGVREYRDRYLMTDAVVGERPDSALAVVNLDPRGVLESFPLPGGVRRFVAWDRPGSDPDPGARAARLRAAVAMRDGQAAPGIVEATEFGVRRVVAPRLRNGRVLVIGDAAHEVSPIGGQGMNLGLLDAATLAPILAAWVRTGQAPEHDLRSWERDRLASARSAARLAAVNTALGRPLPLPLDRARRGALSVLLSPPADRFFAHAYAMGLDRAARNTASAEG
jgi:2-polyprenyl-6-methoxyphenol hydroxylase-like FAD-dependent oxidoreductase